MENQYKYGKKVTLIGTAINIILSSLKLVIGLFSGSLGLIADGFHSLSDLASDLVVFIGLSFAEKPDDEGHHFGHGKFETFSAFIVGIFLALAGIGIGKESIENILGFTKGNYLEIPGMLAFYTALLSIVSKELLFRYTKRAGEKIKSSSIIANAWHHRSDAFSSIGVAIGILTANLLGGKWGVLDPVAGIIVCILLLKEAGNIIKVNLNQLLDASLPDREMLAIQEILESTENCYDPHNIRTRTVGKRIIISLHIRIPRDFKIGDGHDIANEVERKLKRHFGQESIITVHMEPVKEA